MRLTSTAILSLAFLTVSCLENEDGIPSVAVESPFVADRAVILSETVDKQADNHYKDESF